MGLDPEQLHPFRGSLAGFTSEQVHVRGNITLRTTFGTGENNKTIWVKYSVINSPNSYNIIIGLPTFNLLGAFLSIRFLIVKYPLDNGLIWTIRGDPKIARECYHKSLRLQKGKKKTNIEQKSNPEGKYLSVNMIDLNPIEEYHQEQIEPTEDLKEVCIGGHPHQTTKIGTSLEPKDELALTKLLRDILDLFAWKPSNMPEIDPSVVSHHLAVSPGIKPVLQRKRKLGKERRKDVDDEVKKLKDARFISEI